MKLNDIKISTLGKLGQKLLYPLTSKGVKTAYDLINVVPNRYQHFKLVIPNEECDKQNITIGGNIVTLPITRKYRTNLYCTTFSISVNGKNIRIVLFNRQFLVSKLPIGRMIYVNGVYEHPSKLTVSEVFFEFEKEKIEPVYPNFGVSNYYVMKIIRNVLQEYGDLIEENLPKELIISRGLLSLSEAYLYLHMPTNFADIKEAQKRFKYQEMLEFELNQKTYYKLNELHKKEPKKYDLLAVKKVIDEIPFELTEDQKSATNDIFKDLKRPIAANRLIQGDVGSGKTIVAALAMFAVLTAGYQAALMAPTEILAQQHYITLKKTLPFTDIILLTSSIKGEKRNEIYKKIKSDLCLIVGTQSLIQDDIQFMSLGLVVIDEQHRFGVEQRMKLKKKGNNPDCLFLTATPIPRTLAITVFGNLEISSIKTLPNGRKSVITKCIYDVNEQKELISSRLDLGEQAYFIAPLIEESEKLELENAINLFERTKKIFLKYKVSLIHGKLSSKEKDEEMRRFKEGETQILVATTVIEVGVDVKNATIIVIFDAYRFGLSQLHQLRGRVGRNNIQSYCFLQSEHKNIKRLRIMEKTNDGFILSEEDLRLRGPGDFFGTKQSGMLAFRFVDIVNDISIITTARDDAALILEEKGNISTEIKLYLNKILGNIFDLLD